MLINNKKIKKKKNQSRLLKIKITNLNLVIIVKDR